MLKRSYSIAYLAGLVYFVQGAIGVSSLSLQFYLRRSLGWSVSEITMINSIATAPWIFKIFYGLMSDCIPIFGYRRKSYLILSSLFSVLGWFILANFGTVKTIILAALLLVNTGFAMTDVVTDGLIVEHSVKDMSAFYQSIAWGTRGLGAVLSGIIGGWLADHWKPHDVFELTLCLPLVVTFFAFWLKDKKMERMPFGTLLEPLIQCLKLFMNKDLRVFVMVLLALGIGTAFNIPLLFHLNEKLGFSSYFIGILSSLAWLGAIAGSLLFGNMMRRMTIARLLSWALLISAVGILGTFAIMDQMTAIAVALLGGLIGCLPLLAITTTSAKITHGSGVEATLFALLMGIYNLGQITFPFLGGYLFKWVGFYPLVMISAGIAFSVYLLLRKPISKLSHD